MFRDAVDDLFVVVDADGGKAAAEKVGGERCQKRVVGVGELLDGDHHIVVINFGKTVEEVGCGGVEGEEGGVEFAGTFYDGIQ